MIGVVVPRWLWMPAVAAAAGLYGWLVAAAHEVVPAPEMASSSPWSERSRADAPAPAAESVPPPVHEASTPPLAEAAAGPAVVVREGSLSSALDGRYVAAWGDLREARAAEAAARFRRLAEERPDAPAAWLGLALARLTLGDEAGARAAVRRLLELHPRSPAAAALGRRLMRSGWRPLSAEEARWDAYVERLWAVAGEGAP